MYALIWDGEVPVYNLWERKSFLGEVLAQEGEVLALDWEVLSFVCVISYFSEGWTNCG